MQTYLSFITAHKTNFISIMQENTSFLDDEFVNYTSKVARKLLDNVLNIDKIDTEFYSYSDEQKTVLRNELIALRSICRVYLEFLHQNGNVENIIMGE